jgi:spore germination protein YaaH
MRWDTGPDGIRRGRSARHRDVPPGAELAWDEQRKSFSAKFESGGVKTELWFENARTLQVKMGLAREMGFRGISAWVAGQEDPAFWDSIDAREVARVRSTLAGGPIGKRSKRAARLLLAPREK